MAERANVLVVDDELGSRESMRIILKSLHNVFFAEDGPTALKMIEEQPIDLVILDLKMRDMQGIEVLKEIKKNYPQIEVIIVTGYGTLKSASEAMMYSVKGYFTKPLNLSQFTSIVEKAIEEGRFNLKLRNLFKAALFSDTTHSPEKEGSDLSSLQGNGLENTDVSDDLLDIAEYKLKKIKATNDVVSRENWLLEEKLIRSERLVLVGQMAAGYAHMLNYELETMLGYTQLVHNMINKDYPKSRELLEKITTISNRTACLSQLTKNLVNISRRKSSECEPTDVQKLIEKVISYTDHLVNTQGHQVQKDFELPLPQISVAPIRIEQVFLNLILNALHAMDKGGTLTITARHVQHEMKNVLQLEFADNGHGIAEENIKKIFDPFFSTKEESGRVGLGLYISRKIVESYRGTIEVESRENKGTTFIVGFPALKA